MDGDDALRQIEDKLTGVRKGDRKTLVLPEGYLKLDVTVFRRLLNENPEIWKLIDRYSNSIIGDEIQLSLWTETAQFIMDRFPNHEIVFAGDPGFQLSKYKGKDDAGTPFDPVKLNIPSIEFNKIFGVEQELVEISMQGRQLIEQKKTIAEIEAFYKTN